MADALLSHGPRRVLPVRAAILGLAAALCGCGAFAAAPPITDLPLGEPALAARHAPLALDAVTDTAKGEFITPAELARRLEGVRILFIGEEHTDLDAHRVQARVIEALHRAGRRVLIGLEMFPVTEPEMLERWREGLLTESGFVKLSEWYENWGYPWAYYREIFLYARDNRLEMHGVNVPREVVSTMRTKGVDALAPEQRALLPASIDAADEGFRRLFRASFESDDALHAKLTDEQLEGMLRAQATWDAAMGWNAAQAVQKTNDPNAIIVVLIGTGHVSYGLGAERQIRGSFEGRIASLIPVHVKDGEGRDIRKVRASYADFVWGIPEQKAPEFPSLGISLAGKLGKSPTKIIQVSKDSPAARAGLTAGDVLLEIDGRTVGAFAELRELTAGYRWGDVARVKLERDGKPLEVEVAFRR